MRASVGFVLGGVSAVVLINTFNWISPPIPHNTVATVTKVVTEEAAPPEIKYETKPLPDSCETVIDMLDVWLEQSVRVQETGAEIANEYSDVTLNRLMDPDSVTDAQIDLFNQNKKLVDDLQVLLESNSHIEVRLEKCRNEITESNDGEDIPPADGVTGVVPY